MCLLRPEDDLRCHFSDIVHIAFLETGSLSGLEFSNWTSLLVSELQRLPVYASLVLALQVHATMPGLLMWVPGLRLRFS